MLTDKKNELQLQFFNVIHFQIYSKDVPCKRVKKWGYSLKDLLKDPAGKEQFIKFLEKEFSVENLKFWEAVQQLKCVHTKQVSAKVMEIW